MRAVWFSPRLGLWSALGFRCARQRVILHQNPRTSACMRGTRYSAIFVFVKSTFGSLGTGAMLRTEGAVRDDKHNMRTVSRPLWTARAGNARRPQPTGTACRLGGRKQDVGWPQAGSARISAIKGPG